MLQIPYHTGFDYFPNEAQTILENNITEVVNHANLNAFHLPSLCLLDYDSQHNLLTFELMLKDNVTYYDSNTGERDISHLNRHFQHLQTKCVNHINNLYQTHCMQCQQWQYDMQMNGYSSVIPEQSWIAYLDYLKKWQYFLCANIVFVSCAKASYDRRGRVCVVKFKIVY